MQPVRKKIQETHSDLIKEKPTLTLLVDGNSLLFSSFADPMVNCDGVYVGAIFQFLLQLRIQLSKREFDKVFVSFDDTYSGVLRYNIYHPYKQNRDKHYEEYAISDYMKQYNENLRSMQHYIFNKRKKNGELPLKVEKEKSDWEKFVDENFDRCRDRLCLYFNEMGIRWHMDEVCEGDDLIAYYCKNKKDNEKVLIMSSDMDLCQLLSDDIIVYNQIKKIYISNKNFKQYFGYHPDNILLKKVLLGDTSDNIGNIRGLSESKLLEIIPEIENKKVTLDEVKERTKLLNEERVRNKKKTLQVYDNILSGTSNKQYDGDFYEINTLLVDLKNPIITDEMKEEMDGQLDSPLDMEDRSFKNLVVLINEDKIPDLISDTKFSSFFSPFNRIYKKEEEYYKKCK
jgi:5'-3' exonuclease